jgi:hypothetical protein
VAESSCPRCGTLRIASMRFCAHCGFDYSQNAARSSPSQERVSSAPQQGPEEAGRGARTPARTWVLRLAAVGVLVAVFVILNGGRGSPTTGEASPTPTAAQIGGISATPTALATPASTDVATPAASTATQIATPPPTPSPTAGSNKLTAAEVAQVQAILTGSLTHYQDAFAAGKTALGTTQYPDAFAGLAAMSDPTSAAAKFRDWRQSSQIETDLSFLDAFHEADAFYNADNEPLAIADWRDDMGNATDAIYFWVQTAVSWQISEASSTDLAAAAAAVTNGFKVVQADTAAIVEQSK